MPYNNDGSRGLDYCANCANGCAKACVGNTNNSSSKDCDSNCINRCVDNCQTGCNNHCGAGCAGECNTLCDDSCNGYAVNGCSDCEGTCDQECLIGCSGKCATSCTGDCNGSCKGNCASACVGGCTSSCGNTCVGSGDGSCGDCYGTCDDDCYNECMYKCNEKCENDCQGGSKGSNSGGSSGGGSSSSSSGKVEEVEPEIDETTDEYLDDIINEQYSFYSDSGSSSIKVPMDIKYNKIALLRGVSGMPYQFLPDTDRRLFDNDNTTTLDSIEHLGRKYTERIGQRANILFLTPGKASFLKGATKDKKISILNGALSNLYETAANSLLEDGDNYRYYSFDFAVEEYYRYLNPICRAAARYLGLQSYTISGIKTDSVTGLNLDTDLLTHADYRKLLVGQTDDVFELFSNAYGALTFYLDSVSTNSESVSTTLKESELINQFTSDPTNIAQEIKFLSGKFITDLTGTSIADTVTDQEKIKEGQAELEDFVKKYLNNNKLAKFLSLGATTIISGGQIIFPKMWSDSRWDTDSVSVNIKLTSPDTDDLSIFFNILVPMYSLLAMAAPKGYIGIDGYSQPFIVRAFCQSMFNIEAGFITSLSISKGGEGYWTASGLPTSMDISLTIQDIYDSKYISTSEKMGSASSNIFEAVVNGIKKTFEKTPFLKNTAMLNWIANSCGVNVNKPDVIRDIEMYIEHTLENPMLDIFTNFGRMIMDFLRNSTPEWLNILGSAFR